MAELTAYENDQIRSIVIWEKTEPSVLFQMGGKVLSPLTWVVGKIVPYKIIERALAAANATGEFLANKGDILKEGDVVAINELQSKDLELSDKMANDVHNWAIGIATTEGATAGATGVFGMALDIPALITLAYRTMHKIAMCYGFECTTQEDKMFLNHIMSAANANTVDEKVASVIALQQINVLVAKTAFKKMAQKAAVDKFSKEAFVHFLRNFTRSLGYNLTRRKMLQAIPVVGGVVAASLNASFINDVAWAARRSFQKRWLIQNEKIVVKK